MAIAANGKNLMIFGPRQMAPTLSSLRQRQVVLAINAAPEPDQRSSWKILRAPPACQGVIALAGFPEVRRP